MPPKFIATAFVVYLVGNLVGCTSLDHTPTSTPVRFLTFEQGQISGVHESFERVIQRQTEWETLWKQHSSRDPHQPSSFDFTLVSVIAIFLGGRTDGRYLVQITSVVREANHLTVNYQEVVVGKHCTYTSSSTHPYHVILVDRVDVPVQFEKRTETYDCTDPVPFETIEQGDSSALEESLERVIRKPNEWETFWKQHKSKQSAPPPLPAVDFTHESIIAVFIGARSNGGYFAEITGIVRELNRLVVIYREVVAGRNCLINAIVTQPYHIVKLKRIDQPVLFHRQSEIRDCPKPID